MYGITHSRVKRIQLATFMSFCALTGYLFHLQINQRARFTQLSRRNFLRHEQIESPRGNITDQHNNLLVTNRPIYSLYWQGTGNYALSAQQEELITLLSIIYPLEPAILNEMQKAERRAQPLTLVDDLPYELLTQVVEQLPQNDNVIIKKRYVRHYPHHTLACHTVGYLGMKDALGKMGLERLYNSELTGQSGKLVKIINAVGRKLQSHQVAHPAVGQSIQTNLSLELQQIAEELFPKNYEGCLLLMDNDGALEVILSRPSFAPSAFLQPLTHAQWELLQKNNGFINRAFSACYPPASLFKLVTLAAALETKIISPDTQWQCRGRTYFKGRNYHCNRRWGHGTIDTKAAFAKSCNTPYYEIGKLLPIDTLADYAQRLGLGSKTGVLFPENQGLVPTSTWKRRVHNEPWWPGETLSAVIGQSSLLVTPLQMACMIHAVCTGHLVRPRILAAEPIVHEPLAISPSTLSFLQECLASVIQEGTGALLKGLKNVSIVGKSGTAQVRSRKTTTAAKKDLCHGYFAAHFQVENQKPRTLVILLEHVGSSKHAMHLAREFIEQVALLKQEPLQTPS